MNRTTGFKWVILLTIMFLTFTSTNAQFAPKLSLVGGFGVPELFHAGLKLQTSPRSDVGISYGFFKSTSHQSVGWFRNFSINVRSLTLEHSYHFGNVSPTNNRRFWLFRQGLNYYWELDDSENTFSGLLSIGREFPFSSSAGLTLDVGTAIPFSEGKNIIPAARLQLYILLGKPLR